LALVLLKQLQPYLSAQNLSAAPAQPASVDVLRDKQGITQLIKNVNVQSRRSETLPPIKGR
jgi:hypothetical protein